VVVGVVVGVILNCQSPIGRLELARVGGARDPEQLVVVAFGGSHGPAESYTIEGPRKVRDVHLALTFAGCPKVE
jgi:hypothetical protein